MPRQRSTPSNDVGSITVEQVLGLNAADYLELPPFLLRDRLSPLQVVSAGKRRPAADVDAALLAVQHLIKPAMSANELALLARVTPRQAKAWRARAGLPGPRGRPRAKLRVVTPGPSYASTTYKIPFWAWITESNEQLHARGMPHDAIAAERRSRIGHSRPLSARWLRAVGLWGGIATAAQIAGVVDLPTEKVVNYAHAHKLKTRTKTRRGTHAQLAVLLYADHLAEPRAAAARRGVLLAERYSLCAFLQGILDERGIAFGELLQWPPDELEREWSSYGFDTSPVRNPDFPPLWFALPPVANKLVTELRSGDLIYAALRRTNRNMLFRTSEAGRVDEYVANVLGMRVKDGRWHDKSTKKRVRRQAQLPTAPKKIERVRTLVTNDVVALLEIGTSYDSHRTSASDVIGLVVPTTKREVFIPNLTDRIVHRLLATYINKLFDRPPMSFAHQGAKSRHHALGAAKRAIFKKGYYYAAKLDIQKFYPSTSLNLVARALEAELPGAPAELAQLVRHLYSANIVRRRERKDVRLGEARPWEPSPNTLLQGLGSAPILAEIVAAQILDRPFAQMFAGRAYLLRYVDDGLILARDPETVLEALAFVAKLLQIAGYKLHPEKTSDVPVDMRASKFRWLGKLIGIDGVVTPIAKLQVLAHQLAETSLGSRDHRSAAMQIHRELALDSAERKERLLGFVRSIAPEHHDMLDDQALLAEWKRARQRLLQEVSGCLP